MDNLQKFALTQTQANIINGGLDKRDLHHVPGEQGCGGSCCASA